MNTEEFAHLFETLYRTTYARAVRRIPDKRHRLSPETTAFLSHLAASGPMTLSELARHTGRAQSTMSEMVTHLVDKQLLERDRDPEDARRILIWLSDKGREAFAQSQSVLDPQHLAIAAASMTDKERADFVALFEKFNAAIHNKGKQK